MNAEKRPNASKNSLKLSKRLAKMPVWVKILTVIVIGLIGFRLFQTAVTRKKNIATERVYSVVSERITPQTLQEYFRVNGDVMAENTINIIPDIGGRLVQYTVNVGERVTRNQIVAYVDPSKPGLVYSLSPVRAPLAGTITSLPVELGNTVTLQSVVAYMGDLSKLKVETYIPERFVKNLFVGSKGFLTLSAYPGNKYPVTIADLSPVVDPLSRTVWAKLYADVASSELMAGMFGGLQINTIRHDSALVVPMSAVIMRSGNSYLAKLGKHRDDVEFRADALTAEGLKVSNDFDYYIDLQQVELGTVVDGMALVVNGLEPDDLVVVSGQNALSHGSKVLLLKPENASIGETFNEESDDVVALITTISSIKN